MEEKYSEDIADPCDGWTSGTVEEWLCLCRRFHWQVLSSVSSHFSYFFFM